MTNMRYALRGWAVEKFGSGYFSEENNFGSPFPPKVIMFNIDTDEMLKPFCNILNRNMT